MKIHALYQQVTDRIIADLEAGVAPWVKPWKSGNDGVMPVNAITRRPYSGINVLILWDSQSRNGYPTSEWLTFKQAESQGVLVRKGEKGSVIVFTKPLVSIQDGTESGISGTNPSNSTPRTRQMLRTFHVFNVAQLTQPPESNPDTIDEALSPHDRHEAAERFIRATDAVICYGTDRAFYSPKFDSIQLPAFPTFRSAEDYYATVLHELTHWTGHEKRLDRQFGKRFAQDAYAFEELIAELGAAFLCAQLGIKGQLQHASYIASWIKILKGDDRAIFTAASVASRAAEYLSSFNPT